MSTVRLSAWSGWLVAGLAVNATRTLTALTSTLALSLSAALAGDTALAPRAPAPADPVIELCQLEVARLNRKGPSFGDQFATLMLGMDTMREPLASAVPQITWIQSKALDGVEGLSATLQARSLIFGPGPSPEAAMRFQALGGASELKRQFAQIRAFRAAHIKPLGKAMTHATCVERVRAAVAPAEAAAQLSARSLVSELWRLDRWVQTGTLGQQQFDRIQKRLGPRWTYIPYTDLNAVKAALADPSLVDLVLATHATDAGKLIDSYGNEFPHQFFDQVTPNFRSLSLFGCYGRDIGYGAYSFAAAAAGLPATQPRRAFAYPINKRAEYVARRARREAAGAVDTSSTPLVALGDFLQATVKRLGPLTSELLPTLRAQTASNEACELELGGFTLATGGIGVWNGGELLATLNAESLANQAVSYRTTLACDALRTVSLKSSRLGEPTEPLGTPTLSLRAADGRTFEIQSRTDLTHDGQRWRAHRFRISARGPKSPEP